MSALFNQNGKDEYFDEEGFERVEVVEDDLDPEGYDIVEVIEEAEPITRAEQKELPRDVKAIKKGLIEKLKKFSSNYSHAGVFSTIDADDILDRMEQGRMVAEQARQEAKEVHEIFSKIQATGLPFDRVFLKSEISIMKKYENTQKKLMGILNKAIKRK